MRSGDVCGNTVKHKAKRGCRSRLEHYKVLLLLLLLLR